MKISSPRGWRLSCAAPSMPPTPKARPRLIGAGPVLRPNTARPSSADGRRTRRAQRRSRPRDDRQHQQQNSLEAIMKKKLLVIGFNLMLALGAAQLSNAQTAFTYQGRLGDNGGAAYGIYDLRFRLYDALTGGSTVGSQLTTNGVAVSNGLFTVTLDFGAGIFTGSTRWLEIHVRTNFAGSFTILAP